MWGVLTGRTGRTSRTEIVQGMYQRFAAFCHLCKVSVGLFRERFYFYREMSDSARMRLYRM
jgi:hypothetical protein